MTPLPTLIPIFSWLKGIGAALRTMVGSTTAPRTRGAVLVKIGLAMYDFYGSRQRVMPRHRLVGRKRALAEMPALTPAVVAVGTYYDAKIARPERLVLELVQDGLAATPSSAAANYATLASSEGGLLTFARADGQLFAVRPAIVVNAAGPWIDQVNAALGAPSTLIGGTKGSHILLDHDELVRSLDGRMIYFEADDGRICLVFDYLGRALVGSTDIPADDPDTVRCEDEEIDYFLASLRSLLPGLRFEREQIVIQAGVNDWGTGGPNAGYAAWPVHGEQWTLMIPPPGQAPANSDLDLRHVSDVVLRIRHRAGTLAPDGLGTFTPSCG